MKVTVLRRQQANGKIFYVSAQKNFKGVYENFSQKEVENNPTRFEVRESTSFRRTSIHEITQLGESKKLTKPLREFNDLAITLAALHPHWSDEKIQRKLDETVRAGQTVEGLIETLTEAWRKRGLNEPAARIAGRETAASAPPATDLDFWSKFNWGR